MNAKILKTKKSLLNAFYRLAQTYPIADITVSALCKEANINRTTFYKYYSVPSDVIAEAVKNIASKSNCILSDSDVKLYDVMLNFCLVFYENRELFNLYFHVGGDLLPIIYKNILSSAKTLDYMKKPENSFLAGGINGIAIYWLQHDFHESPKEMAELLTEYISRFQTSRIKTRKQL